MKLYHGTNAANLDAIRKRGIEPRGKRIGNWRHTVLSHPDCVYLTSAYAIYYGGCATKVHGNPDAKIAVLEIDTGRLDPFKLYPDEDFLMHATSESDLPHHAPKDRPMQYRTRWYRRRLREFAEHWPASVEHLGNCCYEGVVPMAAVTRIATLDHLTYGMLYAIGMDPVIGLGNYRVCGAKYRNFTHWLFGDPLEEDQLTWPPEIFDKLVDKGIVINLRDVTNLPRTGVTLEKI